jgi:VanZ family protein
VIRVLHAITFVSLLGYWTYLLVKANPVPETLFDGFTGFDLELLKFLLAKALHLGSYTFMALLGGTLVPAGRRRVVMFGLLGLHGALTEVAQYVGNEWYGTNRHGCIRDVLIDSAGVCLGAVVLRFLASRQASGEELRTT